MKKKILPYLLLAPMILIMGVLVFYPIFTTFTYSLKKWKLTAPGDIQFIGFKNYMDILQSESFRYSMQNTIFILVFVVVFTTIIGYLVSVFLNIEGKLSGALLAFTILPWALPPFVNGILWKFVFFSGYGYGDYGEKKYKRNRSRQFKISQPEAVYVLSHVAMYFSREFPLDFATDVGDWKLELVNAEGKTFVYQGSLYKELMIDGVGLSYLLRKYLKMTR